MISELYKIFKHSYGWGRKCIKICIGPVKIGLKSACKKSSCKYQNHKFIWVEVTFATSYNATVELMMLSNDTVNYSEYYIHELFHSVPYLDLISYCIKFYATT